MPNKYLKPFIPLVDAIAETFGKNCEVVLHDFSKPEKSIIKIAHGHVTGRDVGGPITDLSLLLLGGRKTDSLVGYRTKAKKGNELKSTTVFIKDEKGEAVGCICINIDTTTIIATKNMLEEMYGTTNHNEIEGENESPERFEPSIDNLINELIGSALKETAKPASYMDKQDKLLIIKNLKGKRLFLIKGAAKRVSNELNVSLSTIYKYLEEIEGI